VNDAGPRSAILSFVIAAWVFSLEYALYLVADDPSDKAIKLGAACFMLLQLRSRHNEIDNREKVLLILFGTLLATALAPSILVGDAPGGMTQWAKIALMTIVLPLLLMDRRASERKCEWLVSLYLCLGLIFSIQAIVAFVGVMWDLVDPSDSVEIGRRPGLTETTLGVLGYANSIRTPTQSTRWLRPQDWFLEPSLLGSFLLLPAFVCLGRFLQHRKVGFLVSFLTVLTAIFMTASFAAYSGVILGLLFLVLSRPVCGGLSRVSRVFRYLYPIPIFAVFFLLANNLMALSNDAAQIDIAQLDEEQAVLVHVYARNPNGDSGNLVREIANADLYVFTLESNPLGVGFAQTQGESELVAANGLIFWTIAGGLPALLVLAGFFGCIFVSFCHPLLMSDNLVHRCIAASFIGHAVHNLSYGNWLAPYFLIHLAIVCMMARQVKPRARDRRLLCEDRTNPADPAPTAEIAGQ
jgi:hypothetical protein